MSRRTREQILFDVLESLEWARRNFGPHSGYRPYNGTEKKYVLKAVELGLAESNGFGPRCDGDGFIIQNSVEKEGWKLTDKGIRLINEIGNEVHDRTMKGVLEYMRDEFGLSE